MARRLTCQIGGCVVADPFKTLLLVKRDLVIAISLSVRFDQAKHRVVPGNRCRRRDCDGFRDVVRRGCGEGETASADHAADCSNGQESAPGRIYGRVCGWRAKHAVSLGHLGTQSFLARVRAGAEATTSPRLAFMKRNAGARRRQERACRLWSDCSPIRSARWISGWPSKRTGLRGPKPSGA